MEKTRVYIGRTPIGVIRCRSALRLDEPYWRMRYSLSVTTIVSTTVSIPVPYYPVIQHTVIVLGQRSDRKGLGKVSCDSSGLRSLIGPLARRGIPGCLGSAPEHERASTPPRKHVQKGDFNCSRTPNALAQSPFWGNCVERRTSSDGGTFKRMGMLDSEGHYYVRDGVGAGLPRQ